MARYGIPEVPPFFVPTIRSNASHVLDAEIGNAVLFLASGP
jgi:hypothetical protein